MMSVQSEAGFSLVEILVATAVFAVVGVISVALLSTTITAQEVNDDALARIKTNQVWMNPFTQRLRCAVQISRSVGASS